MTDTRVGALPVEVAVTTPADARFGAVVTEVAITTPATARLAGLVVEVAMVPDPVVPPVSTDHNLMLLGVGS